jgi:hypothetical protein
VCSTISAAASEPLAGSAPHARRWLLLEAPGTWGRDALRGGALPDAVGRRLQAWEQEGPAGRVLLIRRHGGLSGAPPAVILVERRDEGLVVRRRVVDRLDELAGADLRFGPRDATSDLPVVLVCTHGKRDACCARLGTPVYRALAGQLGEERVWQCTHLGGHRFAANVLVFPHGLLLGRVSAENAPGLVNDVLAGRVPVQHARGHVWWPAEVQAAELAVHRHLGDGGAARVEFVGSSDGRYRFATAEGEIVVSVSSEQGPTVPVSCGGEPEPTSRFATSIVSGGAGSCCR